MHDCQKQSVTNNSNKTDSILGTVVALRQNMLISPNIHYATPV